MVKYLNPLEYCFHWRSASTIKSEIKNIGFEFFRKVSFQRSSSFDPIISEEFVKAFHEGDALAVIVVGHVGLGGKEMLSFKSHLSRRNI